MPLLINAHLYKSKVDNGFFIFYLVQEKDLSM